jgi:hypothetical protein
LITGEPFCDLLTVDKKLNIFHYILRMIFAIGIGIGIGIGLASHPNSSIDSL